MKLNKHQINNIYINALDCAIIFVSDKLKQKSLITEIGENQIVDKKYKAGLYKGISIALDELKEFKKRIREE